MLQTQTQTRFNDENISHTMSSPSSKKRKRTAGESPAVDSAKRASLAHTNGNSDHLHGETYVADANDFASQLHNGSLEQDISSTAAAALTAHLHGTDGHGLSFVSGTGTDDRPLDDSFGLGESTQHTQNSPYSMAHYSSNSGAMAQSQPQTQGNGSMSNGRPTVGSEEWHKVRRDNHKEVERRRRETINEGINELAKIVPGCEKNKGAILSKAVEYITTLKAREDKVGEKKVLEKVVLEQAVQELMQRNDHLQNELLRQKADNDLLRRKLESRGISGDITEADRGTSGD